MNLTSLQNFFSLIILQQQDNGPGWRDWAGLVLCVLGVIFLMSAIFPGCYQVYKTQNTVYVPLNIYYLLTGMCCCFALGAEFWLIETVKGFQDKGNHYGILTIQASLFLLMNIINGSGNLYVLLLKKENDAEAKKLGISPEEHYEKYCIPRVEARGKNNHV